MTYTMDNPKHTDGIPGDSIHLGADPGGLIAAVPALLGFVPVDSLVLIGLATVPTPAGRPGHPAQVGPVLRTDLDSGAVREGARVLTRAVADLPGGEVVAVHAGRWDPSPGGLDRLTDLLATAEQALERKSVTITAAYSVPALTAGSPWRRLHPGALGTVDWSVAGLRDGEGGVLPDPSASPARGAVVTSPPTAPGADLPSQREFDALLDPVRVPDDLSAALRRHRRSGERAGPAAGAVGPVQVAALLASLPEAAARALSGADAAATVEVRGWLRAPGTLDILIPACDRADLFPVLVVAAVGQRSEQVRGLLAELARLTRGTLRHRVLVLFGLAALASGSGVVGYRAVSRAEGEITVSEDRARRRGGPGTPEEDRVREADRERVTGRCVAALLGPVRTGGPGTPGDPADPVAAVLSEGLGLVTLSDTERASLSVVERDALDAVVDPAAVSAVLRAPGRRVRR